MERKGRRGKGKEVGKMGRQRSSLDSKQRKERQQRKHNDERISHKGTSIKHFSYQPNTHLLWICSFPSVTITNVIVPFVLGVLM